MRRRGPRPEVYRITAARRALSDDVHYRELRYVISMLIRAACFVAAIFVHGPLRFVMVVLALTLPYFAVVFANAGREPAPAPPTTLLEESPPALESGKKANQS